MKSKKTDATRITQLDTYMFHHESWKPIYFGVERSRSRGTKSITGLGHWWLLLVHNVYSKHISAIV